MKTISAVHGITLSAWAFAGLTGNNLATLIVNKFGEVDPATGFNPIGYQKVLYATVVLYIIALIISFVMVRPGHKEE